MIKKNKLKIREKKCKNNVVNQGTKSRSDTEGIKVSMTFTVSGKATTID